MKDRIRLIMENEHLTPSEFADKLGIGRAVMSHILNGRNNPSLEVVSRILSTIKNIDPEWLINNEGEMFKSTSENNTSSTLFPENKNPRIVAHDLFAQNSPYPEQRTVENEYRKENIVDEPLRSNEQSVLQQVAYQKLPEKKISKIIIYYNDNTFETFNADNKPL